MPYSDKERQKAYQREWVGRRRAEYMADKCCVVCGSMELLEVDHIDRATKIDHKVWSWSASRREAELAKCQVLCSKCHAAKTRIEFRAPHGARRRYEAGCRCETCSTAYSAYWSAVRGRKKARQAASADMHRDL